MDELRMLREALPEPQGPSLTVITKGRDLLASNRSGKRPGTWRRRRVGWAAGLAATAVAAAVTAAVVAVGDLSPGPPTQDFSARKVLLAAATKTLASPSGKGRYLRTRTEFGRVVPVSSNGHGYRMMSKRVDDFWDPNPPGITGWWVSQKLGASPFTSADMASWRAAGFPSRWKGCITFGKPTKNIVLAAPDDGGTVRSVLPFLSIGDVGCYPPLEAKPGPVKTVGTILAALPKPPHEPERLDPAKLSTDPATLKKQLLTWIHRAGLAVPIRPIKGDDAQLWVGVEVLLFGHSGPTSPNVRAAAYRVLADLPGVRSTGVVADPGGRRGQGLEFADAAGRSRLILDMRTGLPLAAESLDPSGRTSEFEMILLNKSTNTPPPHK